MGRIKSERRKDLRILVRMRTGRKQRMGKLREVAIFSLGRSSRHTNQTLVSWIGRQIAYH